jgi:hypothetical protein
MAAVVKGQPLQLWEHTPAALGPGDIDIKVGQYLSSIVRNLALLCKVVKLTDQLFSCSIR